MLKNIIPSVTDLSSFGKASLIFVSCGMASFLNASTGDDLSQLTEKIASLQAEVDSLKAQMSENEVAQEQETPEPVAVTSKYGISFYGYVKLDAMYNSGVSFSQEIPFWVQPNQSGDESSFDMTAKETRLGMNFDGPEVAGGKVSGKLEMDFYGKINSSLGSLNSNHAFEPRTRHVYLNWDFEDWSLLAGKTWEPYIILIPQTLNFGYYAFSGQLGLRKTQLTVNKKIGDRLTLTGSLLEPVGGIHGTDTDGDNIDDASDSNLPVFVAKVIYKTPIFTEKDALLGMSVVYGQEQVDLAGFEDNDYDAWAMTAAFSMPLTDFLTWKLNAFTGSNLDSYWGGIGQGINQTLGRAIDGVGGWTQLQIQASPSLSINLGYSVDNPDDEDLNTGARSKNTSYLINAYYNFDSAITLGLEYYRGETDYKDSSTATNNHIHSSIIYKF